MSEQIPEIVATDVVVKMDYTLTVDDEIIDSTDAYGPFEFIQGHRNIIPGLERELFGMQVGETKEILVEPAEGYGEFDANAFIDLQKSQFPPDYGFAIGKSLRLSDSNGRLFTAVISEIGENDVRVDLNHPLAGKQLKFVATILDLRSATEDELTSGKVGGGACATCGSSSGGCGGSCG